MGTTSSHKARIEFVETSHAQAEDESLLADVAEIDQELPAESKQAPSMVIRSSGDWVLEGLYDVDKKLYQFVSKIGKLAQMPIHWDVSAVGNVDSAGMILFIKNYDLLKDHNFIVEIVGASAGYDKMYRLLRPYVLAPSNVDPAYPPDSWQFLPELGKITVSFWESLSAFLSFLGENCIIFLQALGHPLSIRYGAIVKNIEEAGVRAMPIIGLTSFLIGVVIAYQGAVQLEKFGANIFIVDMISIAVTRELAPMITAIVVAGRTGSSYTAQIGVMKITEEIDAMRTMGFDPLLFLVQPRILALMIVMPLLIFFADIIGILAGMLISNIHLNISYGEFLRRLQIALEIKHVWIGLMKGPFFAWLIAAVACFRGFQVSKSTESIGRYTTISVVNAIFLVIACDALFSVLLTELGI